jgi:RNA polymerase sigma factor (sigma-70 family)
LELALTAPSDSPLGSFDALIAAERSRLVRSAYAILRDRDEAEDVVQQTLLAVWQRARQQPLRNLEGYLARAVYWNALKRRVRRTSDVPLEAVAEPATGPAELCIDPFELERAIAELPPAQQTVIRLRFYLGLTFREIAANLAISTNTAASRTRYALKNLRRLLDPRKRSTDKEARDE